MGKKRQSAQNAASNGAKKARSTATALCPAEIAHMAQQYADLVIKSENKNWTWMDIKTTTGGTLKKSDKARKAEIKKYAIDNLGVKQIPVDANEYADFTNYIAFETVLPANFHHTRDPVQFREADKAVKAVHANYDEKTNSFPPDKKRYTWHHHQGPPDGRMQLVEFGVHNATNHKGGRTTWATGSR